jgi:hypothetical protein
MVQFKRVYFLTGAGCSGLFSSMLSSQVERFPDDLDTATPVEARMRGLVERLWLSTSWNMGDVGLEFTFLQDMSFPLLENSVP